MTRRISRFGLLLAVVLVAGGTALIAKPTAMRIVHAGQKPPLFGTKPSVEYAGPASMRFYGACLLVFGVVVGGFFFYLPRR